MLAVAPGPGRQWEQGVRLPGLWDREGCWLKGHSTQRQPCRRREPHSWSHRRPGVSGSKENLIQWRNPHVGRVCLEFV